MKKITDYILRSKSVVTEKENLEPLYTFKDFPVFMGCVDTPQSEDLLADMEWNICRDTGIIQLGKLLPLEVLYLNNHNDGTGKVWQDHYTAFAKFLHQFNPKNVLEIGGAHDHIVRNYRAHNPDVKWTIVEPNPEQIDDKEITVIKAWFDDTFTIEGDFDTVIHSHVFEHTYDPLVFIEHISKFMKKGDKHIFTFPTLLPMIKLKWTNALNFEHTAFLTEDITEYILKKFGFKVLAKEYYGNPHSVFYATERVEAPESLPLMENKYEEYKKLYMDYVEYHLAMVKELNALTEASTLPVYLFGAHIFSQTLIQFGLKTDNIVSILDNSAMKQGKRLYGTGFMVESPKILKDLGPVNIILKAASYNNEIKKDIFENINDKVVFW